MLLRVLLLSLLAASLSAQNVKVNWDKSAFFSTYKTYKWIPLDGSTAPHALMVEEIVSQTDGQLKAKSLSKSTGDQVDLLVAYQVSVDKPPTPTAPGQPAPYQPGPTWNGKPPDTLPKGTRAINLYDAKSKALIWRALITAEVGESRPSDKVKVAKGLSKAFAQYPPMGK